MAEQTVTLRVQVDAGGAVTEIQGVSIAVRNLGAEATNAGSTVSAAFGLVKTVLDAQKAAKTLSDIGSGAAKAAAGARGFDAVGRGLLSVLGGWPGAALAAGGALLALWDWMEDGERAARAPLTALQQLNGELERRAKLNDLIASGRASESNAPQVLLIEEARQRAADFARELEVSKQKLEDFSTTNAGDQASIAVLRDMRTHVNNVGESLELANKVVRRNSDLLAENAHWIDLGTVARRQIAQETAAFRDSLSRQIDGLRLENEELQHGLRARLELEAVTTAGVKSADQLDQKTRNLIDTRVAEAETNERLKSSQQAAIEAKEQAKRADEALTEAATKFTERAEQQALVLAGPAAQAAATYREELDAGARLFAAGKISADQLTQAIAVQAEVLDSATAAAAARRTPVQQMLDDLDAEAKLIGLVGTAREVAIARQKAEQALQQQGIALDSAEAEQELALVEGKVRSNAALTQAAEAAKKAKDASAKAAEEYKNAWKSATDKVTGAFGDFLARGGKGFKNLGKQLKDSALSLLKDLTTIFLRNQLKVGITASVGALGASGSALANFLGSPNSGQNGSGNLFGGLIRDQVGTDNLFSGLIGSQGNSLLSGPSPLLSTAGQGAAGSSTGIGGFFSQLFGQGGSTGGGPSGGASAIGGIAGSLFGGLIGGKAGAAGGSIGGSIGGNFGPWGAAVGAVIGSVAGSIIGAKFVTVLSGVELSIGDSGASGFKFQDQTKKSLFSKKKKRTLKDDLDADAQSAIDDIFVAISQSVQSAAASLGVDTPALIAGTFRQEFDKKGKLKREFSTIAGQVVNESQEAFAKRLQAVNLLATLDAALGPVAQQAPEAVAAPILEDIDEFSGAFGSRFGEAIRRGMGSALPVIAQVQGEASQIAERWRGNAEKLLAGAQFLLAASVDMRNGFTLLGEGGTLTSVTALIEELNKAGESLSDTYARVVGGTKLLEQALTLQNQSLDLGREQFVRFATEVVNAAGGLERAQTLWSDYFNRFFNDNERAAQSLSAAQLAAQAQFDDIDLTASDFAGEGGLAQFRALFEQALPTLSADAVVQWLEAAQAIGLVIDAQAALNQTLGDTAQAVDTTAQALVNQLASVLDNVRGQARSAEEALANFGLSDLAVGLRQITRDIDAAIAEATRLGATESELAEIRALGAARTELLQRKAQADLANLLSGVAQSLFELDASPLEIELARIQRAMSDTLAQATALGASEEQLAQIRQLGSRQSDRATAAAEAQAQAEAAQRAQQLSDVLDGVAQSLFELDASPLEIEIVRIQRATQDMLTQASELGASEEQLARIRALGARQSTDAIEAEVTRMRDVFAQLAQSIGQTRQSIAGDILGIRRTQPGFSESGFQGGRVTDLRAQLDGAVDPQQRVALIDQIREATLARYSAELASIQQAEQAQQQAAQAAQQAIEAQRQALDRLRGFVDTLGLSGTSPLTAFQRLDVAQSVFDQTLARARGGDLEAIGGLQEAANALLTENRNVFGVSDPAVRTFEQVRSALSSVAGQGVRGAASISDPFQRASLDTSARIAQLQESAIAELQGLDDALATLELTQQAESEGSIEALRARFDQAERHQDELIENILPFLDAIGADASTGADQLNELRAQTQALAGLIAVIEGQQGSSNALLDKFLVFMKQLQDQTDQQQAEMGRMARAIEATIRTGARA